MSADVPVTALAEEAAIPLPGAPVPGPLASSDAQAGSVLGTVVALGGLQMLAIVFTVARSKAVALSLGPSGVGAVSLIDQVVGLAGQVATFSLPFAAVKFLSAEHSNGPERFSRLYASFTWALVMLSVIGTVVAIALLYWWPSILGRELSDYGTAATLAFLSIPGVTLVGFLTSAIASARRTHASGVYGLVNAAGAAVLSMLGVVVAGLNGYYVGGFLAASMTALIGVGYLASAERARVGPPQTGMGQLRAQRGVVGFAGSLYATAFALPAANLVARYAILKSSGLEATGLLQAAMALGLAMALVLRQSNTLLLTPTLNRDVSDERKLRQAADYLRSFSLVIGAATIPMLLFPRFWLYALYSRRFLPAAPYAYLFILGQIIQLIAGVPLGLMIGLNRIGAQLAVTLSGFVVLAVLSWLLAPAMGIAGIGAAVLAQNLLVLTCGLWYVWRNVRFHMLQAAGWLPLWVVAGIAVVGALSARYSEVTPGVILVKIGGCVILAALALFVARREGLLTGRGWLGRSKVQGA